MKTLFPSILQAAEGGRQQGAKRVGEAPRAIRAENRDVLSSLIPLLGCMAGRHEIATFRHIYAHRGGHIYLPPCAYMPTTVDIYVLQLSDNKYFGVCYFSLGNGVCYALRSGEMTTGALDDGDGSSLLDFPQATDNSMLCAYRYTRVGAFADDGNHGCVVRPFASE